MIQEAKDLNILLLEELLEPLMTHELAIMQHNEEETKIKIIALKSTTQGEDEFEQSKEGDKDEEMALITRKLKRKLR